MLRRESVRWAKNSDILAACRLQKKLKEQAVIVPRAEKLNIVQLSAKDMKATC